MTKNRLRAIEKIISRRGIGSHEDYLQAITRTTARARACIEYRLHGCAGEEPPRADQKDWDVIREYELSNHITPERDAKRRIEEKLDILRRRMYAAMPDDGFQELVEYE